MLYDFWTPILLWHLHSCDSSIRSWDFICIENPIKLLLKFSTSISFCQSFEQQVCHVVIVIFWVKHSVFSQENIIYIRTSLRHAHVNLCLHLCRALILGTTPILILSLSVMSLSTLVDMGSLERAILFHLALTICFCSYVIGLGPIPNVLCSEMFPTKARATCLSFCSLSFWFGGLLSAYCFPVMLSTIGLGGACGIYALMCCIALCLIYYRIPEMTAFNLEFIAELFQNSRQSRYI